MGNGDEGWGKKTNKGKEGQNNFEVNVSYNYLCFRQFRQAWFWTKWTLVFREEKQILGNQETL